MNSGRKGRIIRRSISVFAIISMIFLAAYSALYRQHYLLLSIMLAGLAMVPFFLRFERRNPHAREIVLIALLAAIAAVSRVPFAFIPSVQPTSFFIIIAALALGAESGFMIGAAAALVSNMFLMQGIWTPFQMLSWGLMGLSAGMLRHTRLAANRFGLISFGVLWGFLFGWMMNATSIINVTGAFSWEQFLAVYAGSFYFDLMHALSNAFFLGLFGMPMLRMLKRFRSKYGLLEEG